MMAAMALRPIQNRALSEDVFEQLSGEIIGRTYKPGDKLPPERTLVDVFGVNRHVIREAIKRLQQVGLVQVVQGGGTRVLDFHEHAGLDLLSLMTSHLRSGRASKARAEHAARLWRGVLEMRAAIGTDMARLCALRANETQRETLLELAVELAAAPEAGIFDLEVRFWRLVAEGSDNLAYRLALNSMLGGADAANSLAVQWSASESKAADYRRPLAAAIAAGDADAAETETRRTMRAAVEAYERAVGLGPKTGRPTTKPRARTQRARTQRTVT